MNAFAESVRANTNEARTKNGALSNENTLSYTLDFFSKSGALRGQTEEAVSLFSRAVAEDEVLALRSAFYMRDVRGGQGERDIFRAVLLYMTQYKQEALKRNMRLIPDFGRWDDLFTFIDTPLQKEALDIIKTQFLVDRKAEKPSLLGKWMKSINTSSKESVRIAKITAKHFGLTERQYRKAVSALRAKINVLEVSMSKKDWKGIEYNNVPSQAARIYSNAFLKHDEKRYEQFIADVAEGKKSINASTLYPYQIVKGIASKDIKERKTLDALWKNLPDYMETPENSLCVVDTSGSMYAGSSNIAPIDVSVSLGIYFAEKSKGAFKDYFMTFSESPKMQKIIGSNIYEKYINVYNAKWGYSTDLQAVFNVLLKTAVENEVPEAEMPKKIYIISDMQFNSATSKNGWEREKKEVTNFDAIDEKYRSEGYERPTLVFWNVNSGSDTPVTMDEYGTYLVSGCSPSILKYAMNTQAVTPIELMMEVLDNERYSVIK